MISPFHMKTNLLFLMGLLHSTFCRHSALPRHPGIARILMYCLFLPHIKLIKEPEEVKRKKEEEDEREEMNLCSFLTLGSARQCTIRTKCRMTIWWVPIFPSGHWRYCSQKNLIGTKSCFPNNHNTEKKASKLADSFMIHQKMVYSQCDVTRSYMLLCLIGCALTCL